MTRNMLIETRDGFDYMGADYATWMRMASFTVALWLNVAVLFAAFA